MIAPGDILRVQVQEVLHTDESGGVRPETNLEQPCYAGPNRTNVIEVTDAEKPRRCGNSISR